MFNFKEGDIIINTGEGPWRKIQLFKDHIFIIESLNSNQSMTSNYAHKLSDYTKPTINIDPIPNPFRLEGEYVIDRVMSKYGQ